MKNKKNSNSKINNATETPLAATAAAVASAIKQHQRQRNINKISNLFQKIESETIYGSEQTQIQPQPHNIYTIYEKQTKANTMHFLYKCI